MDKEQSLTLRMDPGDDIVELPAALALADLPIEAIGAIFILAAFGKELPEGGHQKVFDRMNEVSADVVKMLADRKIVSAAVSPTGGIAMSINLELLGL